jgi:hypothetical protein
MDAIFFDIQYAIIIDVLLPKLYFFKASKKISAVLSEKIITDICLPELNSSSASLLKKIFSLAVYSTESSIWMLVPQKIDLKSTVTSRPLVGQYLTIIN